MKILITGGTGSLGRALIQKLKNVDGVEVVVFSRDEGKHALYFGSDSDVQCFIGDIRDYRKLDKTMKIVRPDRVIHTAALKRIDDMEFHPDECVKTNIQGSENVALAALKNEVEKCILISTDKACQPVNVYGSSKFIAERIFTNFDYNSTSTIFSSVRYGNVIASRGSFIPLWLQLIRAGKEINITSMECSRFLFTLSDAVDTVLNALDCATGGEIFIPNLKSFRMRDIVSAVGRLAEIPEVKCNIVGLRPGEKIHEDMLSKTELPYAWKTHYDGLLAVVPQYTKKKHIFPEKYVGRELNSEIHVSRDVECLIELINAGLQYND
tara:strand:+ start:4355 stop:5326 length:972 start_codon:yes stop_codon:yes gene_type:complete